MADYTGNSYTQNQSGKMSPSAVLVIQNGRAKMISVKSTDTVSKIMDMIPEIMDKITSLVKKGEIDDQEAAIEEAISDIANDEYIS